jgi:phenylpyruvate tautomerase PptA (4-oxalocrotonate tautomerase family)
MRSQTRNQRSTASATSPVHAKTDVPIILIRLPGLDAARFADASRALSESVATALRCPVRDVWTYWQRVEFASMGAEPQTTENRVAVITILGRGRPQEQVRAALEGAAQAVSKTLALPLEDVWVHWDELPEGRVFAGGQHF